MRWLMISMLASLLVLLIAVAGMVYHIRVQHRQLRHKPVIGAEEAFEQTKDSDLEP